MANQIEADSIALLNAFLDANFLSNNGFDRKTAIAMYIPNSYDFYWNTDAVKFREKMLTEYKRFWSNQE